MTKLQITITAVIEYEANPEYYPDCKTAEDMLKIDLMNADNEPFDLMSGDNVKWTTSGKVLNE